LQALAEQSRIVRLPLNKIGAINKVRRTFSELEQEFEREPQEHEIAERLDLNDAETIISMKNSRRHVSMDAPLTNEEDSSSMYELMSNTDTPDPDFKLLNESLSREIDQLLVSLPGREAEIVRRFFGLNGYVSQSLEEIGDHFELTRERVRQIKEKAVRRLKINRKSRLLKTYLG
jgi:RNA polymerase primary sigma factor